MLRPLWVSVGSLAIAGMLGCRDAPDSGLRVASAGAQTPARAAKLQSSVDASRRTALVTAADLVSAAVVSINVTSRQEVPRSPWDFVFVPEGARLVQGYGTGFILRPNGIIV